MKYTWICAVCLLFFDRNIISMHRNFLPVVSKLHQSRIDHVVRRYSFIEALPDIVINQEIYRPVFMALTRGETLESVIFFKEYCKYLQLIKNINEKELSKKL